MPEDDPPIAIPEWVVTFGDMMSLLLTFFIMLVSLSEIKEEEKFQALVESMRRQFGYTQAMESMTPGESKPRTSDFSVLATIGRAKKKDTAKGGVPEKAPHGEEPMVRIIRPGQTTAVGSVVFFDLASDRLDENALAVLKDTAEQLRGKPQKIEVRGHVSTEYAARTAGSDEAILLGVRRAAAVRRYLVETAQLEMDRFRISSAGASEPMQRAGVGGSGKSSRVEVFLLDETVEDLDGTMAERRASNLSSPGATAETN